MFEWHLATRVGSISPDLRKNIPAVSHIAEFRHSQERAAVSGHLGFRFALNRGR
jgi:hypothetical protein